MEVKLYNKIYLSNITKLSIMEKHITDVDSNIKYFINLQKLNLCYNQITSKCT